MPKKFISDQVLREILEQATEDEKLSLTNVLDMREKMPHDSAKLHKEICERGSTLKEYLTNSGTSYLDIINKVADELNLKGLPSYELNVKYFEEIENLKFDEKIAKQKGIEYAKKAEEKIILKLLELEYDKLDSNKKEEFDKQLNNVAKQFDSSLVTNLTGVAGLNALKNLGEFATYTFLTIYLKIISTDRLEFSHSPIGSALTELIGPLAYFVLDVARIFGFGIIKYELTSIVIIIGTIRQRIEFEKTTKQ